MTENVSYKRCVCDICGKEERIPQSLILPKGWDKTFTGRYMYDTCIDCIAEIDTVVEDLKEKKILNKSHSSCINNNIEQDWDFCK